MSNTNIKHIKPTPALLKAVQKSQKLHDAARNGQVATGIQNAKDNSGKKNK